VLLQWALGKTSHSYHYYSTITERMYLARVYNDILDLVPGFRDQMDNLGADPSMLDKIIDAV
jgi:hypothetical protein